MRGDDPHHGVLLVELAHLRDDGVGLREVKFIAWKPAPAADDETRRVLYKGPFAEIVADGNRVFTRGQRVAVPSSVWHALRLGPAADQFLFFEPGSSSSCSGT